MATPPSLTFRDIVLRINCEPITPKELLSSNPRLFCIYKNAAGQKPQFVAAAEKTQAQGNALGTFYDMVAHLSFVPSRWLGKVGHPTGHLRDDPSSTRTRARKDINLDTILEMLAYTFYQEFGRKLFIVPNTFLSRQPVMNAFTLGHALAIDWHSHGITKSLRIMCEMVPGYFDFAVAKTSEGGETLPFMEFILKNHRPPNTILSPLGTSVPLLGIMELLAVIRAIADTDGLGGGGKNAGFIWVTEGETIIAARAVKIDPGCAFQFSREEEGSNRVINTVYKLSIPRYHLTDTRNIQIANVNTSVDIHWDSLSIEQREIFLSTLMNSLRYRNNKGVLKLLFYRDGKFNRNPNEQIPEQIADKLILEMSNWLALQEQIYTEDLKAFYKTHPEQLLRIQYIDTCGQLHLPTSKEKFPIRELFTELVLVDHAAQESEEIAARDPELPETDSLRDTFDRLHHVEKKISLQDLFEPTESRPVPRKLLLLGRAGIGKSTICQKISHDWASGRLWNDRYTATYWLPLRQCNHFSEEESDPRKWLSQALAHLILKEDFLVDSINSQLRDHPQQILIILDGYDEATPAVAHRVKKLLQLPELNLLIASRPGHTEHLHSNFDRIVENMGFSDDQIESYIDRFLQIGQRTAEDANTQKKSLISALKKDRNLFGLAHIPLQLQMLCTIWDKKGRAKGFPPTLTALYHTMVEEIFRWQFTREGIDPDGIRPRERINLNNCLGDIALRGLISGKLLISENMLQQELERFDISHKDLLTLGLLKTLGEGAQREYYFIHLSYQEYLIALSASKKTPQEREQFILTYRYHPQFQLVFGFLAGIINQQDTSLDKRETKKFIETLHAKKDHNGEVFGADLIGAYQLELTLRCLSECDLQVQLWANEKYYVYQVLSDLILQPENNQIRWRAINWCKLNKIPDEVMSSIIDELCITICSPVEGRSGGFQRAAGHYSSELFSKRVPAEKLEDMVALIKQNLNHPNENLRILAVNLLESFSPEDWQIYFEILKIILKDPSENVRIAALYLLGSLAKRVSQEEREQVFELLKTVLNDENIWVRKTATFLIREFNIEIRNPLEEKNGDFQEAARYSSEPFDKRDPFRSWEGISKAGHKMFKDRTFGILASKALTACYIGDPLYKWIECWKDIYKATKKALKDPDESDRIEAVKTLEFLAKEAPSESWEEYWEEIFEALKIPLNDSNEEVRIVAVNVLEFLAKKVPIEMWKKVFETLKTVLNDENNRVRRTVTFLIRGLNIGIRIPFSRDMQEAAAYSLESLGKRIPPERWEKVFKSLKMAQNNPNKNVRLATVDALGSLCKGAPPEMWKEVLAVLKLALDDPSKSVREKAVSSLRSFDKETHPEMWKEVLAALKEVLNNGNSNVRTSTLYALANLSKSGPPEKWADIFALLKIALNDEDYDTRKAARRSFETLAKSAPPERWAEIFAALKEGLNNKGSDDRTDTLFALVSLSELAPPEKLGEVLAAIKMAMSDEDEMVRCVATATLLEKLSKLAPAEREPEAWTTAIEALNSNDTYVRSAASRFLVSLSDVAPPERWIEVWAAIKKALNDEDGQIQGRAEEALKILSKKTSPERWVEVLAAIKEALKNQNKNVRVSTIRFLGSLVMEVPPERKEEVLAALKEEALNNEDELVKDIAGAKFLGFFGKEAPLEKWQQVLAALKERTFIEEDFWVRDAAVESLGFLAQETYPERWIEVWAALKGALKDDFESIRIAAAEISLKFLAKEPPPEIWTEIWTALKEALKKERWSPFGKGNCWPVRKKAVEFIGSLGKKEASPERWQLILAALKAARYDEEKDVRIAAVKSLESLAEEASPEKRIEILGISNNYLDKNNPEVREIEKQALKNLIKAKHLEKKADFFTMPAWDPSLIELFIDVCMKRRKPVCLLQLNPEQPRKLYFGRSQEDSRPFTPEFMQMMRQVVAKGYLAKYVASYAD